MWTLLFFGTIWTIQSCLQGTASGTSCTSSFTCGTGNCCRDGNGKVISTAPHNGVLVLGGRRSGNCTSQKAQKGEMCDSSCHCDTGLACYRPLTGFCCPPTTCVDEAYAKQQEEYWANCRRDPNCHIPR